MRAAFDHDQLDVADQAGQLFAGFLQGQDLVGVALDDQDGHVDLGQVVAEVGGPGPMQATAAVAEAVTARFQLAGTPGR